MVCWNLLFWVQIPRLIFFHKNSLWFDYSSSLHCRISQTGCNCWQMFWWHERMKMVAKIKEVIWILNLHVVWPNQDQLTLMNATANGSVWLSQHLVSVLQVLHCSNKGQNFWNIQVPIFLFCYITWTCGILKWFVKQMLFNDAHVSS